MAILRRNLTITSGVDYESPPLEIFNANGTPYNFGDNDVVALFNKTLMEVDVLADVLTYVYFEFRVSVEDNIVTLYYDNNGDPWYLDEGKYRYIVNVVDDNEVKIPIVEGELTVLKDTTVDSPNIDPSPPPYLRFEGTPSPSEPDFPTFGMLWKDISIQPPVLKIWSGNEWILVGTEGTRNFIIDYAGLTDGSVLVYNQNSDKWATDSTVLTLTDGGNF